MAFIIDAALDALLAEISSNATILTITSQEATTRTEAVTTFALGNKTPPSFTGPADRSPNGRKVAVDAITDGTVSATGTATHYAIVDGTRLLATGSLSSSQPVTSGNTFTLTSFDVGVPDAV